MRLIPRAGLVLVMFLCGHAAAQVTFDSPPPDALAWWSLDPRIEPTGAERAQRRLLEATLSTVLSSGMVGEADAADVIGATLIASTVGATAHQFTLLELEDAPGERIARMKAILEIRGPVDHEELISVLQAVLVDAHDDPGEQRALRLPGRREGMAFRRDGWPSWLEVSWTSGDGVFYVGIGADALSDWFSRDEAREGAWQPHEHLVRRGTRVLTVYLDVDGLRRAAPGWFGRGEIGGDILTAWSLSNARRFMVHAHLVDAAAEPAYEGPPLLAIDATWEARSEPAGTIHRREVTAGAWPSDMAMPPPSGRFVIVAPTRVLEWIQRGLSTRLALSDNQEDLFRASRRWAGRTQGRIRRVLRASSSHVILGDAAAGTTRLPLLGTAYLEVDQRIELSSYEREIGILSDTLGEAVTWDESKRIWSVRPFPAGIDPTGSLSVLAWGMAQGERPVLIVGWSIESVEEARRRLER